MKTQIYKLFVQFDHFSKFQVNKISLFRSFEIMPYFFESVDNCNKLNLFKRHSMECDGFCCIIPETWLSPSKRFSGKMVPVTWFSPPEYAV